MSEFTVRPFAFMRLTHEALRAGFTRISSAAEAGDVERVREELAALRGVITLHARQEDEVFFPMLDRLFDGAVEQAGLRDAHGVDDEHQARLDVAIEAEDVDAIREEVDAWGPAFEKHLKDEETVMMPLTQKVADTLEGRAAAVREIIELDWESLRSDHLPYVVASLSEHKPYGPLRMFVAALQVATAERFTELEGLVRDAAGPEKAEMLKQHGHLS